MRHHPKFVVCLVASAVLLLVCSGMALAQETTGSIVGAVKDANGAAVANATITVTDTAKKVVVRTVQTNDDGQYTARDLPVTSYDVTVEAKGFKKHIENGVQVDVGHQRTVDINLVTGDISETVTVPADPPAPPLTPNTKRQRLTS